MIRKILHPPISFSRCATGKKAFSHMKKTFFAPPAKRINSNEGAVRTAKACMGGYFSFFLKKTRLKALRECVGGGVLQKESCCNDKVGGGKTLKVPLLSGRSRESPKVSPFRRGLNRRRRRRRRLLPGCFEFSPSVFPSSLLRKLCLSNIIHQEHC